MKNRCSETTFDNTDDFKNKRKRTNSIFQIEKHTENKIVKGWNQMINDLTPKMTNMYPIPSQTLDRTSSQANSDEKTMQDFSNVALRKNNILSLPQVDISQIQYRLKFKSFIFIPFIATNPRNVLFLIYVNLHTQR